MEVWQKSSIKYENLILLGLTSKELKTITLYHLNFEFDTTEN